MRAKRVVMKRKPNLSMILLPTLICTVLSCKEEQKQTETKEDTSTPHIIINEPEKQQFKTGDTLKIYVEILDFKEMHEGKIWLISESQNDTLWSQRKHLHDQIITFRHEYLLSASGKLKLVVHGENALRKSTSATYDIDVAD